MEDKHGPVRWVENRVVLYAIGSLFIITCQLLYGIWTGRIEYAISRIDVNDKRVAVLESSGALRDYQRQALMESLQTLERRCSLTEDRLREIDALIERRKR